MSDDPPEPTGRTVTHPDWMARRGGTVPWREVEAALVASRNYWVASIRRDGRPHARPVWGAWLDQRLLLSAGGGYWMLRNLRANPLVSANLEAAEGLVVVVEGRAVPVREAPERHLERGIAAYNAKYEWDMTEDEFIDGIELLPERIFAWRTGDRDFHDYDSTRFDFTW